MRQDDISTQQKHIAKYCTNINMIHCLSIFVSWSIAQFKVS